MDHAAAIAEGKAIAAAVARLKNEPNTPEKYANLADRARALMTITYATQTAADVAFHARHPHTK